MTTKENKTDILIIGGGIAGLTLAALLGKAGIRVDLVSNFKPDKKTKAKPTGRTVALMQSSLNVIKATGAWDQIEPNANPMQMMRIIDSSAAAQRDPVNVEFEAQDIGFDEFGYNIPNTALLMALYETVTKIKTVTMHAPKSLESYEANGSGAVAALDDSTQIAARLIVGADGAQSTVRKIAGIECWQKDYDQTAITCLINHSQSHNNTSTEFHRPAGPLAFVPLPGNQSSVVWVESTARADEIMRLKKQDFESTLQNISQGILGGMTLEAGPESWPLRSLKAKALTAPRMALVAEAAHVLSPITAQGLNLSLRDVAALAETIIDNMRLGLDPGTQTALKAYAKRRRIDIDTRVYGVNTLNQMVSHDAEIVSHLRRAGLKAVDKVPVLKETAMKHGLAPGMDGGRLVRGEAL